MSAEEKAAQKCIFTPLPAPAPAGSSAAAEKTAAAVEQQTSSAADTADADASSQPEHCTKPPPAAAAIAQERTESAEMRVLRERVCALEQQLASTATDSLEANLWRFNAMELVTDLASQVGRLNEQLEAAKERSHAQLDAFQATVLCQEREQAASRSH